VRGKERLFARADPSGWTSSTGSSPTISLTDFHPERLAALLAGLTARRTAKAESVDTRIMVLQRMVTDSEDKLKRLYRLVEDGATDLDDVLMPFREAYLRSLIDVIEVDDNQVRIRGSREVLERAVAAGQAAAPCSQMSTRWRSLGDSNPCFRRERANIFFRSVWTITG
jgi:site-specific DNA recombinase